MDDTMRLFEVHWVAGRKEGSCRIRALDAEDAINELQANASWYGVPHRCPLVLRALPVERTL